jgi:acyl-CoA thioesterase I
MRRRSLFRLAAAGLAALLPAGARAEPPRECAVPPEMLEVHDKLPYLALALREKAPVKIVAIGGNSTKGTAAGSPDNAYPHRLQLALAKMYPDVPITVINQGMARQTAQQMLDRFPPDVADEKPVLVIWEAGITDAVRGVELDDFAATLQTGIDLAKNRAIDILLVDMQFSRRAATVIDFERYLDTIRKVGELNDVYVFPRFAIMRYWSEQHMFNFDEVAEAERTRLAAKVYDCIGLTLAEAIRNAVR